MWKQLTNSIMNLRPYEDRVQRNRALIAYSAVYLSAVLFTVYMIFVPILSAGADTRLLTILQRAIRPAEFPLYTVSLIGFYGVGLYGVVQIWRGALARAVYAPSAMIYFGIIGIAVANNLALSQNAYLLIPPLLLAGLLDGDRGVLVFTPVHFVTLMVGYTIYIGVEDPNTFSSLLVLVMVSIVFIGMLYLYLRTARDLTGEIEESLIRQRLQIAQLTTRITRSIAEPEDVLDVLNQLVHEIRDTFPQAYHVQVFLIDETGRVAQLVASTGEVGRLLLENSHSLPVGSSSVIGYVTQQQRAYRTVVGEESEIHRPNPYLPDTRLEVALPLIVGTRNIGALDLQSKSPDAFMPSDLTTLQAIADAIAVTINNSRLLEQTANRLRENQLLVERMSATQREVERLNRELTGAIWADYLRGSEANFNIDLDFEADQMVSSSDLSDALLDAISRDDIVRRTEDGRHIVAVPLRVRGEVIGAMEFELEQDVTNADMEMLREVGERFGLAAENNRLYENSQRVAQREALVNEISTRIQSANSVDATMVEAARSLRDALKARRVAIRLGSPQSSNGKE